MNIRMMGIDHSKATVEYREIFALTTSKKEDLITKFIEINGVSGCIILSTCNRMEVWVSLEEDFEGTLYGNFCRINNIDTNYYKEYFVERNGEEAIDHLFSLTCGMKSKIIGEDQILSQVKDALSFSRENYCTDNVFEVLFRTAITAAKKVKTQVHLSKANASIVDQVIYHLKNNGNILSGKKCLVIGNGEVGKLAAVLLKEEGADVTVTVRQYRSGFVEIPKGCNRINYGDRLNNISDYDIVVSATASPNVTLKYEGLKDIKFENNKLFIDLAVPRDIEAEVSNIENIDLYDIDSFHVELSSEKRDAQMIEIREILNEHIKEFTTWYKSKDLIPQVKYICKNAAFDVNLRLEKRIKKIQISDYEKESLEKSIGDAAGKVINKMMFGLMDSLEPEKFHEFVAAIRKIY